MVKQITFFACIFAVALFAALVIAVAPTLTVVFPTNVNYTSTSLGLNYTITGAADTCWYSVNAGTTNTTITCGNNVTGLTAAQGDNTWRVYGNDSGGLVGTSSMAFYVDSVVPAIAYAGTDVETSGSAFARSNIRINITATDASIGLKNITVSLYNATALIYNATTTSSPNFVNQTGLPDGTYIFNATAADKLNNVNSTLLSRSVRIDTTKPNFTVIAPGNISYGTTNRTINFTSSDAGVGVDSSWFYNETGNTTYTGVKYNNLSEGSHTFIFYSNDSLGNTNSTSVTFLIDLTNPAVTIHAPFAGSNHSNHTGEIFFNASVSDGGSGIGAVYFSVMNGTEKVANITSTVESSGVYTGSLNTTDLADGIYNVTVYANDSVGNLNSSESILGIVVDNTDSVIDFTCDRTTLRVGETITCSCTATDATSGVNSVDYTVHPSTYSSGSYTTTCTVVDYASNTAYADWNYSSSGGGSHGGGGGGSSQTWTNNYAYDSKELGDQSALTTTLGSKDKVTIKVAGVSHYVGVKSVSLTSADIEIASNPIQATLNVGETKKFDLNADGTYDLAVTLNSIISGDANMTIGSINEKIATGSGTPQSNVTQGTNAGTTTTPAGVKSVGNSNTWVWWIVGVVVIVLILFFVLKANKKRKTHRGY